MHMFFFLNNTANKMNLAQNICTDAAPQNLTIE